MRFWDSSAVVPALIEEPSSGPVLQLLSEDTGLAHWWVLPVECCSGLWRQLREGRIDQDDLGVAMGRMDQLLSQGLCVEPTEQVRIRAKRMVALHSLRSADAMHLAAALVWCGDRPKGIDFVCLDSRLRDAALREGFTLLPAAT